MSRDDQKIDRRKFLKGAAVGAAAVSSTAISNAQDQESADHQHAPSDIALRVKALETVLTEKNLVDPSVLDEVVDRYENRIGPQNGAKVVAKAWVDSDYKARLLDDGTAAIGELDLL